MKLELYYTEGCHLCELADDVIKQAQLKGVVPTNMPLLKIDIALNDELVDKYGLLIPVVKATENEEILNWPFSLGQFEAYLKSALPS